MAKYKRIYTPGCPLPPIPNKVHEPDKLFPSTSEVHTLCNDGTQCSIPHHCIRDDIVPGHVDCTELWRRFDPLFCKVRDTINWGSMGIITKLEPRPSPYYRYSWHMVGHANEPQLNSLISTFVNEVNEVPGNYLLLGKCAEARFLKAADEHSNIKCFLLSDEVGSEWLNDNQINGWLEIRPWNSETPFDSHIDEDPASVNKAWREYVNAVSKVAHDGSILYIPAVCYRGSTPLLAGGVIWCIKKGKLEEAINAIPEAQLFMRWMLSEITKVCPQIGLAQTFQERINSLRSQKWASSNNSRISHTLTQSNASTVIFDINEGLLVAADDQCKSGCGKQCDPDANKCHVWQAHSAAKYVLLPNRNNDHLSVWFIGKLLEAWATKIIIDSTCDSNSHFEWKCSSDLLDFLSHLLVFLDEVTKESPEQSWKMSYAANDSNHKVSFELIGMHRKCNHMDFAKLEKCRADGKSNGVTLSWATLCGDLCVCKESDENCYRKNGCAIVFNDNRFTLSYKINTEITGHGGAT